MTDCSLCHGDVVGNDDITIVDRTRHVDGVIDVVVPTNCTTCHGGPTDAAPVPGTPGAGAHRTHLDGTAISRPVECSACHIVPTSVLDAGHIDTARPGEVTFSGTALANGASPVYSYATATCSGTPCHGAVLPDGNASGGTNTTPDWNRVDGTQAPCGSCHAIPPPAPHPYVELNPVCSACHQDIAPDNVTFTRPDLHVDGRVTFTVP
jgi:predicted CxxxxCH...CXXCH cytochrome family protein